MLGICVYTIYMWPIYPVAVDYFGRGYNIYTPPLPSRLGAFLLHCFCLCLGYVPRQPHLFFIIIMGLQRARLITGIDIIRVFDSINKSTSADSINSINSIIFLELHQTRGFPGFPPGGGGGVLDGWTGGRGGALSVLQGNRFITITSSNERGNERERNCLRPEIKASHPDDHIFNIVRYIQSRENVPPKSRAYSTSAR